MILGSKKEDLIHKKSLYSNQNPHSNGEIQSLSNSNFILSKNNNQVNNSTTNINNNSNNDLSSNNKQEINNLYDQRNDSVENLNKNSVNNENNSNANKNVSLITVNLNVNCDSNNSLNDFVNHNPKNEKNIDSSICKNETCNNNFSKNDLTNMTSTEYFRNINSNLKNQSQPNKSDALNAEMKKNQSKQPNINKNQFSSNDSNSLIQIQNQEKNINISAINQKNQDSVNPNKSSNKKIVNINETSVVSKKNNNNVELESQKLREIKKNVYNISNNIENQDHALTQKVPVNTTPNLLKDKKFNLNEHILNNHNLKQTYNTNFNNQLNLIKKESEINVPASKNNQIASNTKNNINAPINNPIINYMNNTSNVNINNNIKKDNQSNALSNFDKKRYNLKKFQTSTDSNLLIFIKIYFRKINLLKF